jgi:hypothetical protein
MKLGVKDGDLFIGNWNLGREPRVWMAADLQRLVEQVQTLCEDACKERAAAHRETIKKSRTRDERECSTRAAEADKCARAIKDL